jgi:hypothetical protein
MAKNLEDMSFDDLVVEVADLQKEDLAYSIVENAKKGDAGAMKLLQVALERAMYQNEDKLKISPDQFKNIILHAARHLESGPVKTV